MKEINLEQLEARIDEWLNPDGKVYLDPMEANLLRDCRIALREQGEKLAIVYRQLTEKEMDYDDMKLAYQRRHSEFLAMLDRLETIRTIGDKAGWQKWDHTTPEWHVMNFVNDALS